MWSVGLDLSTMKCSLGKKKFLLHLNLVAWQSSLLCPTPTGALGFLLHTPDFPQTGDSLGKNSFVSNAFALSLTFQTHSKLNSGFHLLLTLTKTLILTLCASSNPWNSWCRCCFGSPRFLSAPPVQLGLFYSESKQNFEIKVRVEKRERPELQLE